MFLNDVWKMLGDVGRCWMVLDVFELCLEDVERCWMM